MRHREKVAARCALLFAVLIAALYALVCFRPLIGVLGPFKYHFANPFKLLAVVVLSLQVWWLLTRPADAVLRRATRLTWWQMKLSIEGVELCFVAVIGVLAIDLQWQVAPIIVLIKPTLAFMLAALAAAIVALTAGRQWSRMWELLGRCRLLWRGWNWRARFIAAALLIHVVLISKSLPGYWEQTSGLFLSHETAQSTTLSYTGKILCNFDFFCLACGDRIPADARILFHGGNEGLILAFELYPRRVFMLPQEQRDMFHNCWKKELWCRGMAADPLDKFWRWDPPLNTVPEDKFIEEHGITHVVMFDPLNAANCRIQAVR